MAIFYVDSGSFKNITVTGSINISNGGIIQGTASYATTASYALNAGSTVSTASLLITASVSSNTITFTKGDGTTFPITVNTGSNPAAFPYTGSAEISGSLKITRTNTDYTNVLGTNSHIILNNPSSTGQTVISFLTNNTTGKIRHGYDGSLNYVSTGVNGHYFWTGGDYLTGSIKMYISSSGNVGIGTITPQTLLDLGPAGGEKQYVYYGAPSNKLGFGVDLAGGPYEFSTFFSYGATDEGTYNIGSLNGTSYNVKMTVKGDGSVGIGTTSPTSRLHVYDPGHSKVAHFEGANGYPIQIVTTDESFSGGGYAADIGSIGNSAGTLHIKTGSADLDWSPIMYPKRTTGIDLSGGDYTIPGPGTYEITNAQTNDLIFPDPSLYDGERITIANTDGSYDANIDNTNTFAPYERGKSSQLSVLTLEQMFEIVSIGGKWRALRSA